jgi:hypothetical protein
MVRLAQVFKSWCWWPSLLVLVMAKIPVCQRRGTEMREKREVETKVQSIEW